jgi:histidinol-phosphate/aromatic aminotransferase/cobyric acid decarboxylase-like protein
MFEFLVETYAAPEPTSLVAARVSDVALAAEQMSEAGAKVRFLGAIVVPEDETSFYLCESSSADAVREALTRAGLRVERISEAVSIGPCDARARTPHTTS